MSPVIHFLLQLEISLSNLYFTDTAKSFWAASYCKQQNKYNFHNYLSSVSFAYNCCSILKDTSSEYTQIQTVETWWLHIVLKLLLLGLHTVFPFITILLQKHEMYCCRYLLALSRNMYKIFIGSLDIRGDWASGQAFLISRQKIFPLSQNFITCRIHLQPATRRSAISYVLEQQRGPGSVIYSPSSVFS